MNGLGRNGGRSAVCSALAFLSFSAYGQAGPEPAPRLLASEILPPALLRSASHRVAEAVGLTERLYAFELEIDEDTEPVTSLALLEQRVAEAIILDQAIAQYDRAEPTRVGESEVGGGTTLSRGTNVGNALTSELDPELIREARRRPEREGGALRAEQGIAFDTHKRSVAQQLDLDPYSANPRVQSFLDRVAEARASGRFSAGRTLIVQPPPRWSRSVAKGRLDVEIRALLRHLTLAELYAGIEDELLRLGLPGAVVQVFVRHESHTPFGKASIAAHLDYLVEAQQRGLLLRAANEARNPAEALAFDQLARMLALYHGEAERLQRLFTAAGRTAALGERGTVVLPLPVDLLHWDAAAAALFEDDALADAVQRAGGRLEVLVRGRITPRARDELAARGIQAREEFLSR